MQLAQIENPALDSGIRNIRGDEFFARLIPTLVTLFFVVGTVIFVFMLLTGAASWIMSGGDKTNVENARQRVTHALVGLIILFSVYALFKALESIFGITFLTIDLGSFGVSQ